MLRLCIAVWSFLSATSTNPIGGPQDSQSNQGVVEVVEVACKAQTEPITVVGDAADDPAVWVHPSDPALSLVIGTNKKAGLLVYGLDGRLLQTISDGRMNNVDVAMGRVGPAGSGEDLVFSSNRTDNTVVVYRVNPQARRLERLTEATIQTGLDEVYGLCAYVDAQGAPCVVVGSKAGRVKSFAMRRGPVGWSSQAGADFQVGAQIEGLAADAEHGWLYIGEEQLGLWRYPIGGPGPDRPARRLVDVVAGGAAGGAGYTATPHRSGQLAPDVEGVTIYDAGGGRGWLIVSCQGEDRFAVYDRKSLRYVGSFRLHLSPLGGERDQVTHTDGITAMAGSLGPGFPEGAFVAQDDNGGANQCFKIASWAEIAAALKLSPSP